MNIHEAYRLARSLMDTHGLHDWTFGFDRATIRFGVCKHRLKHISLSRA